MNKTFYIISWFTITLAIVLLLIVIYWLVYPYKAAEFSEKPFRVEPKVIEQGQYLTVYADYCKYVDIQPEIERAYVDGLIYTIPKGINEPHEIGCDTAKIYLYIPKALPPGKYYVNTTYLWRVNPIRSIKQETITETFEVI